LNKLVFLSVFRLLDPTVVKFLWLFRLVLDKLKYRWAHEVIPMAKKKDKKKDKKDKKGKKKDKK